MDLKKDDNSLKESNELCVTSSGADITKGDFERTVAADKVESSCDQGPLTRNRT